jgi:hypothetical protein
MKEIKEIKALGLTKNELKLAWTILNSIKAVYPIINLAVNELKIKPKRVSVVTSRILRKLADDIDAASKG